jgi:epoxyqueuosine reductase
METPSRMEEIPTKAITLGASLAGIVPVADFLASLSDRRHQVDRSLNSGGTLVVLASSHSGERPELDWWDSQAGRTPGNRRLLEIGRRLIKWLRHQISGEVRMLPYQVGRGGIFLKDAAVLAGLGVIGRNNLLVTPEYGPRVRLGALLLDRPLAGNGALAGFAPCDGCPAPCQQACPQGAFHGGGYRIDRCLERLTADERRRIVLKHPLIGMGDRHAIAYCRRCELACPVGA